MMIGQMQQAIITFRKKDCLLHFYYTSFNLVMRGKLGVNEKNNSMSQMFTGTGISSWDVLRVGGWVRLEICSAGFE